MKPLFSVLCSEKGQEVDRLVSLFELNDFSLKTLWEKIRTFPNLYGRDTPKTQEELFNLFFSSDPVSGLLFSDSVVFIIDDYVGMVTLTNIYHPDEATIHFIFFDKRMRGRADLLKAIALYVFKEYGLRRLNVELASFSSPATLNFVSTKLGLTLEGKKRKAILYNEKYHDVLMYGLLAEEAEQWEPLKLRQLVEEKQEA